MDEVIDRKRKAEADRTHTYQKKQALKHGDVMLYFQLYLSEDVVRERIPLDASCYSGYRRSVLLVVRTLQSQGSIIPAALKIKRRVIAVCTPSSARTTILTSEKRDESDYASQELPRRLAGARFQLPPTRPAASAGRLSARGRGRLPQATHSPLGEQRKATFMHCCCCWRSCSVAGPQCNCPGPQCKLPQLNDRGKEAGSKAGGRGTTDQAAW
ncbi:hypothetical protein KUCAC02_036983 [Chaenocephalus aceratus]|nr:hypothetical protein KUCAC02_036983 [Chaenocephalus aceratus]